MYLSVTYSDLFNVITQLRRQQLNDLSENSFMKWLEEYSF